MFEQYNDDAPASAAEDTTELRQKLSSGANWFYWIAGLSVINSIANFFEANWNFAVGLGITQFFDGLGIYLRSEGSGQMISAGLLSASIVVAGMFFLLGVFANRQVLTAFVFGIVVYFFDALLMLIFSDFLGIIIHVIALIFIIRGFLAARQLRKSVLVPSI